MKKALLIGLGYLAFNGLFVSLLRADCTPPSSGLVAWYKAENGADDSVNTNHGTPQPDVAYAVGKVGQAFLLTNANAFIQVPANAVLASAETSGALTIEAWINISDATGFHPIAEWNDGAGNVGTHFWVGRLPWSDGELFANIIDTNGVGRSITAPNAVTGGVFQHVALTYDSATGIGLLYVNGEVVAEENLGSFVPRTSFDFWLGHRPGDSPGDWTYGSNLGGLLDELAVYNRALSQAEIQAIYNAGAEGKCNGSGPFAPYIFTHPQGQTVTEGESISLSVYAGGTTPYSYQWRLNGTNIASATNSTLALNNLHSWQSGNYSVKVTTPYGNTTSSNALVTVLGRTKLVYTYSGTEKTTGNSNEVAYTFSGQMVYFPDATNGVFIGWATIGTKKQYWVTYFSDYQLIQFIGKSKQVYTVLGKVGGVSAENGAPNLWSYFHKGANAILLIGTKKNLYFPSTFSARDFLIYPDQQIANMILRESNSTYNYAAQATQTANNSGQTIGDLITLQTKALEKQGYKPLAN